MITWWVLRPFWYGQLFLPLLGAAGLLGIFVGLAPGVPQQAGRWAVGGLALVLVVAAAWWGYADTRRLVVRPRT